MRDLIGGADVFSQGYRLGTLDRRGFSPGKAAALRPGVVYVSENCYGHLGPWSQRPGWEQLGQAATGMAYREGLSAPDGVPRLAPAAVSEYSTGHRGPRRHDGAGPARSRGRVVACPGVAQPDLHVVPAPTRRY